MLLHFSFFGCLYILNRGQTHGVECLDWRRAVCLDISLFAISSNVQYTRSRLTFGAHAYSFPCSFFFFFLLAVCLLLHAIYLSIYATINCTPAINYLFHQVSCSMRWTFIFFSFYCRIFYATNCFCNFIKVRFLPEILQPCWNTPGTWEFQQLFLRTLRYNVKKIKQHL